jgi:hypothetical protein
MMCFNIVKASSLNSELITSLVDQGLAAKNIISGFFSSWLTRMHRTLNFRITGSFAEQLYLNVPARRRSEVLSDLRTCLQGMLAHRTSDWSRVRLASLQSWWNGKVCLLILII